MKLTKALQAAQIGAIVASLREEGGFSLSEVAARAQVAVVAIYDMEHGTANPTIGQLLDIAHAFNRELEIDFVPEDRKHLTEIEARLINLIRAGDIPEALFTLAWLTEGRPVQTQTEKIGALIKALVTKESS